MAHQGKMRLGEILIEQKILTPLIVTRVLQISQATHRRLGQTLEDFGLVTGEEIAQALAIQCGYKVVFDICRYPIPQETLRLVSEQEAFENRIFPLQVKEGTLALAMADPTISNIVAEMAGRLRLKVIPVVSTTRDIMKAIAKNYLGQELESRTNAILVVETNGRERESLVTPLKSEGYHVLEAVDAADGCQLALLHQPELVLTAKEMPDSDGFAFFTTLQGVAETRRIPIILLSPRASVEEEAMAFRRGFFDYIPTPVRDITLVSRVERALAAGKSYVPHRQSSLGL